MNADRPIIVCEDYAIVVGIVKRSIVQQEAAVEADNEAHCSKHCDLSVGPDFLVALSLASSSPDIHVV